MQSNIFCHNLDIINICIYLTFYLFVVQLIRTIKLISSFKGWRFIQSLEFDSKSKSYDSLQEGGNDQWKTHSKHAGWRHKATMSNWNPTTSKAEWKTKTTMRQVSKATTRGWSSGNEKKGRIALM